MTVFDLYAAYYDLLYCDKNYAGEAEFVASLIRESLPTATTLLELGCGTGGHALHFVRDGWTVDGIDLSPAMIECADRRRASCNADIQSRMRFQVGDVRTHRAGRRYDAVVSLFHVISYQTSNADQGLAFATARDHLSVGGIFVFDFWYGPAVLTDRPRHVVREVSDTRIDVTRVTTPRMVVNANRVDVDFDVKIVSRLDGRSQRVAERHAMRYLFLPEIEQRLGANRFELQGSSEWLSRASLDDTTWYGCVVARAT